MAKKNTQQPQEQFKTMIGGQALIEGIMMQGPEKESRVRRIGPFRCVFICPFLSQTADSASGKEIPESSEKGYCCTYTGVSAGESGFCPIFKSERTEKKLPSDPV